MAKIRGKPRGRAIWKIINEKKTLECGGTNRAGHAPQPVKARWNLSLSREKLKEGSRERAGGY